MSYFVGVIFVVISSIGFGFMPVFAKLAYASGLDSYTLVVFRFVFASCIFYFFIRLKKIPMAITKKQLKTLVIVGTAGCALTAGTLFASYKYMSAGLASTMHFVYPGMVSIAAYFILKEEFTIKKLISLILSLLGLIVLINFNDKSISLFGSFLAILSAITYAIYIVGISFEHMKAMNGILLSFYVGLIAAVSLLIINLIFGTGCIINIKGVSYSFLLALFSTAMPFYLFIEGIKVIGPSNGAILSTLEPIVGVVLGAMIFDETITTRIVIGCILIFASVLILSLKNKEVKN